MQISEILWPKDRVEHISRHGILPGEIEEICFGKPLLLRARQEGKNPVYFILGQTNQGRFVLCIMIQFPDGKGFPVTARDMTEREKKRYKRWRKNEETKLPKTDSIRELADFWDNHDLTDFEDSLEEVKENVFDQCKTMSVHLKTNEFEVIEKMARKKGLSDSDLVHEWIREKLKAA